MIRPVARIPIRIFHGEVHTLIIISTWTNIGIIGCGSAEDIKLLGGSGSMLPPKNFEILDPQIPGCALKLPILL